MREGHYGFSAADIGVIDTVIAALRELVRPLLVDLDLYISHTCMGCTSSSPRHRAVNAHVLYYPL